MGKCGVVARREGIAEKRPRAIWSWGGEGGEGDVAVEVGGGDVWDSRRRKESGAWEKTSK
jgi:hypothetical protein